MRRLIRITMVSIVMVLLAASFAMASHDFDPPDCDENICEGHSYSDDIDGNNTSQTFYVYGGNDTVAADGGDDTVYGGDGNDYIWGQEGDDSLYGGLGNDYLYDQAGDDTDSLSGSNGRDRLNAADNDGRDVIRGGKGDDVCIGDRRDTFRGCENERIR